MTEHILLTLYDSFQDTLFCRIRLQLKRRLYGKQLKTSVLRPFCLFSDLQLKENNFPNHNTLGVCNPFVTNLIDLHVTN